MRIRVRLRIHVLLFVVHVRKFEGREDVALGLTGNAWSSCNLLPLPGPYKPPNYTVDPQKMRFDKITQIYN
jgi:hypothetical protein